MNAKTEDPKTPKGNIIVFDTCVVIDDPESVDTVRIGENANNLAVIPWQVMLELDKMKTRPGVGHEAREAVRRIRKASKEPNSNLIIENQVSFSYGGLDKSLSDHKIMATVVHISKKINSNDKKNPYFGYKKIKFLTNDEILQGLSEVVFRQNPNVLIEPLLKNQVKEVKDKSTKKVKLGEKDRKELEKGVTRLPLDKKLDLKENEMVMFLSNFNACGKIVGDTPKTHFIGIKKGNQLEIIKPDIKVFSQTALNDEDGKTNWGQVAAIHMLKDPDIKAVFLQGGAGSGKTFLALAGGLEAKKDKSCKKIVVMRLQVPLDSKNSTGTLPGGIESKHAPWLLAIIDNLTVLCPEDQSKAPIKGYDEINFALIANHSIVVQPLDYVKGSSFRDSWIIVEEAQDLTQRQIKQILTRVGKNTKIIFTGDLGQISEDDRHINRHNSGLPHAVNNLVNETMVGSIVFDCFVRSPLAALAEKRL